YVTASHIFPTDCKKGLAPRGVLYLRDVAASVKIPVYALGGIHEEQIETCIEAGAAGVCMMSDYMKRMK
ncbi:MAG: thiamine phosphate synthase, partial [Dorea sp.]|nr:thiamine phosphate synthase [Dorea sp.]